MAGKNTRKYLESQGFDAFYDLYRGLSKEIKSKSVNLMGYIEVLRELEKDNKNFLNDTDACVGQLRDASQTLHTFFWPRFCDDIQDHQFRRECWLKRWEPFDEAAWDSMFAELLPSLEKGLQVWEVCYEKIKAAHLEKKVNPKETLSFTSIVTNLEKGLVFLARFCNQEWMEFYFFQNWFLARLRQSSYSMISIVMAMERTLKNEPTPIPEDKFHPELERIAATVTQFKRYISPSYNPDILFADIPLSYKEAEWDAIWAKVAGKVDIMSGELREQLRKLQRLSSRISPSDSTLRGQFKRIESDLEIISRITQEMRYEAPLTCPSP